MDLTWYGLSCFRMKDRGMSTIVCDPYKASLGLPALKLTADVVTTSHDADGHNNYSAVSDKKHVLDTPGEYEVGDVFITGIASQRTPDERPNVIFVMDFDSVTVAHMGDLAQLPQQAQIDALGEVNVLLVPIGGGRTLNASQAAELVAMVEPNIVVPMHYAIDGLKLDLEGPERFLKEMGVTEETVESKLRVGKTTMPEETQVVMLAPKI